jgi:glycosyltransferase involved in cell wall biosynthesis
MSSRGEIAFYAGSGAHRWAAREIERSGLGGAETATVGLASALASRAWRVTVYGHAEPDRYRGVRYAAPDELDLAAGRTAIVCSGLPAAMGEGVAAERLLLWPHVRDGIPAMAPGVAERVDAVLAVSDHVGRLVGARHPDLADRIVALPNGVEHTWYSGRTRSTRARRVLYTAQPERGLDILLELWPSVRARVPDAELAWCYAPVYEFEGSPPAWVARFRKRIDSLAAQPGVRPLGSLSQPALGALMRRSSVWAHPSWATAYEAPFDETSCLGALQAQAAGMYVVAADWGALPETVRSGTLIPGEDAPEASWRAAFAEEIVRGLIDADVQRRARTEGPAAMRDRDWHAVAHRLEAVIASPPAR